MIKAQTILSTTSSIKQEQIQKSNFRRYYELLITFLKAIYNYIDLITDVLTLAECVQKLKQTNPDNKGLILQWCTVIFALLMGLILERKIPAKQNHLSYYKKAFLFTFLLSATILNGGLVILSFITTFAWNPINGLPIGLILMIPQIRQYNKLKYSQAKTKQEKRSIILQTLAFAPFYGLIGSCLFCLKIHTERLPFFPEIKETWVLNYYSSNTFVIQKQFMWTFMLSNIYYVLNYAKNNDDFLVSQFELYNQEDFERIREPNSLFRQLFHMIFILYVIGTLFNIFYAVITYYEKYFEQNQAQVLKNYKAKLLYSRIQSVTKQIILQLKIKKFENNQQTYNNQTLRDKEESEINYQIQNLNSSFFNKLSTQRVKRETNQNFSQIYLQVQNDSTINSPNLFSIQNTQNQNQKYNNKTEIKSQNQLLNTQKDTFGKPKLNLGNKINDEEQRIAEKAQIQININENDVNINDENTRKIDINFNQFLSNSKLQLDSSFQPEQTNYNQFRNNKIKNQNQNFNNNNDINATINKSINKSQSPLINFSINDLEFNDFESQKVNYEGQPNLSYNQRKMKNWEQIYKNQIND
ncbi:hypothetical protein PPERSA_07031 [Pseudocohnilembus persalinus]|uniref:Transmembrane protein n=1 Tax=Pseudocohnilembus persalinus TaxID=266149 RepID=A0A0V0QLK5_PSEPJ|nr:hypothetical protein PPERSA_07031 [Pseudocohnilembus persalinus]|eukprot:KRX03203.1 hypothetical protein PPERSA_07031 [Pseudocohnilembus persalinus]